MKYFFVLFFTIVSCKENTKPEKLKTFIKQEILESNIPFYDLFLKYETKQELFNKFPLDTSKYSKIYVLQGESKLISREFEDIKTSDILNEVELEKLNNPRNVFKSYQWDNTIDRSEFNTDFIDMYKFNSREPKINKTEIFYFFTYPYSVSKDKMLIGFEVKSKTHHFEKLYMGYVVFNKVDDKWSIIGHNSFGE